MQNFHCNKEWLIRLTLLFLGLVIAHLGVTMFIVAELGTDCFTILVQGIANVVGLSIGTVHVIMLCLLTVVMLVTTKGYIKAGSVVCAVCGGWIIDFFLWINNGMISVESSFLIRLVVLLLGIVILSLGMSLVIKSDAGTGPNDLIAVILTDKLKKFQFRWVRLTCDVTFLCIGVLLGGVFGIGTAFAAIMIGPCVQYFFPKSERFVNYILRP
ncbi:MAG: hypothetical protein R3Y53_10540 [Bacillota bacterium]